MGASGGGFDRFPKPNFTLPNSMRIAHTINAHFPCCCGDFDVFGYFGVVQSQNSHSLCHRHSDTHNARKERRRRMPIRQRLTVTRRRRQRHIPNVETHILYVHTQCDFVFVMLRCYRCFRRRATRIVHYQLLLPDCTMRRCAVSSK